MPVWDGIITDEEATRMAAEWGRGDRDEVSLGERPALLVVDMAYAFVDDRFPLGYGKTGWPCAAAIERFLTLSRNRGLPVLFSCGQHARNGAERGRWKSAGRTADDADVDPNEIVAPLRPQPDETVVRKRRPSAFFGTELASLLVYHRIDTVILTGMVTSGCVRATAVDAFSYNFRVIVPEECVADRMHTSHAVTLFDLQMKYADVVSLSEVEAELTR